MTVFVLMVTLAVGFALFLYVSAHTVAPEPSGRWRTVKSGSWGDVQWTLFATKPNGGGRCLALETHPPISGSDVIPESELYRGKAESCAPSPGTGRFMYLSLYLGNEIPAGGFNYLLGETVPGIDKVRATFATDGPQGSDFTVDQEADTSDGFVVMLYAGDETLMTLQPMDGNQVKAVCPTLGKRDLVHLSHC